MRHNATKGPNVFNSVSERIEGDFAIVTFENDIGKTFEVKMDKNDLVMRSSFNNKRIGVRN